MSRGWTLLLALVLVGSLAAELLGPEKALRHLWDHKLFFALYGFVGCAVIVFVSKAIGKSALQRRESYYADPDDALAAAPSTEEPPAPLEEPDRD